MSHASTMFDLEKHGEEQLAGAIKRLPPGATLVLAKSGLAITAVPAGARRFQLRVPPRITERPDINFDAFAALATAPAEFAKAHKLVLEQDNPPTDGEQ